MTGQFSTRVPLHFRFRFCRSDFIPDDLHLAFPRSRFRIDHQPSLTTLNGLVPEPQPG
jgi:hypothetical protein